MFGFLTIFQRFRVLKQVFDLIFNVISFYDFTKAFAIYTKVHGRNTTESFIRLMCFILYSDSISINILIEHLFGLKLI